MGCASSKTSTKPIVEKTATDCKGMWEKIQQQLPRQKTPEDEEKRNELFEKFDQNGTGKLTVEEFYQGCVNILHFDEFTTHLSDIVKHAFNTAKSMANTADDGKGSGEFIEHFEFRLMLSYMYDYFALTVIFDQFDPSGSMVLDAKEFEAAVPKIGTWGLVIDDPEAAFKEIDIDGSGQVTFDEFAAWATAQKLKGDEEAHSAE